MIPPNLIWQFREFQISEILVKLALPVPRKKEANQIMVSTLPEFQGSKSSHILCFSQLFRQLHKKTSIWCLLVVLGGRLSFLGHGHGQDVVMVMIWKWDFSDHWSPIDQGKCRFTRRVKKAGLGEKKLFSIFHVSAESDKDKKRFSLGAPIYLSWRVGQ